MRLVLYPFLLALLLGGAIVGGHELVYEPLVVPRLPGWRAVPLSWWGLVYAPALAVCAAATVLLRSKTELLVFSLLGALAVNSSHWFFAVSGEPGFAKEAEGGATFFVIQWLVLAGVLLAVTVVPWLFWSRLRGHQTAT